MNTFRFSGFNILQSLENLDETLFSVLSSTDWPLTKDETLLISAYRRNLKTFVNKITELKSNGSLSEKEIHDLLMKNYLYPLVISSIFYLIRSFNGETLNSQTQAYCSKFFYVNYEEDINL